MTMRAHMVLLPLSASMLFAAAASATPSLDPLFSDHAVLQRGRPIIVSGQADAGEQVTLSLNGRNATATAGPDGRWSATLPAQTAGGPFVLTASSAKGSASANDILIGDVWLCAGQSNMEYTLAPTAGSQNAIASAKDDQLRLITIPKASAPVPVHSFGKKAEWAAASPQTAPGFSAVCYYMVRALRETHKVPIGAINASWGGTQIRAWLDPAGSRTIYGEGEAAMLKLFATDPAGAAVQFAPRWESWWREKSGDKAGAEPWNAPDSLTWKPVPSISYWEGWPGAGLEKFDGMVWFRKTVTLTAAQAKRGATLSLGIFDELDQSWVNGKPVGNSFGWDFARNYRLAPAILKAGRNEIVIALTDTYANGGMKGPASALKLSFADGSTMPIGEGWLYSVAKTQAPPPRAPWDANAGLGLIYNGMIAPMGAFGLKGVAWYQGESDVGVAGYDKRLAALFKGWRAQFLDPDLPMLVVQLPNFGPMASTPVDSGWAALRNEQREAVAADPRAALIVTLDLGDPKNLHPLNKAPVGARLEAASAMVYGDSLRTAGPEIESAARTNGGIRLSFRLVAGALHGRSGRPIGFELCAETQASCRYADAVAEGTTVMLADDGKPATRVRYAWADSPAVNLFDEADLTPGTFEVPIGN
ncbi:MAG TPA: sialate O-acetylesterase [Sphingobium sp.]